MFDFFTSPWYMAAGGALVSAPILIHLINRMRFKRIRWAAMEFLLKSQKRNRRRLIIEQLILLLLRILLVLLAAFLVARFLYAGAGARGITHVIMLDDTFSMMDRGKAGNQEKDAYAIAAQQTRKIFEQYAKAPSTQNVSVYLFSNLESPFWEGKLSDKSANQIEDQLSKHQFGKPTLRHVRPLLALQRGRQELSGVKGEMAQGQKILHVVSDFRDTDWSSSSDAEKTTEEIKGIVEDGTKVKLVDCALPYRSKSSKVALFSDNLALLDLRADTRVAIADSEVEFTTVVQNFGQAEAQTRLMKVYVNGEAAQGSDQVIEKVPAGQQALVKFKIRFPAKDNPQAVINEKDGPAERERKRRLDREFYNIRVTIPSESAGINVDNVRDLVVEVRRKIPTLVVDGNKPENRTEVGDMSHLQAFMAASSVYDIEELRLNDLINADLDLYPSIMLLNVAEIPPEIVKRLKLYVEAGGSLCYFLGEEVKPEHYNTELFKAGIFPLQIGDRAFDPQSAAFPDPEDRQKQRERLRQSDPTPKILFPIGEHPLVARLAPRGRLFRFLSINVYWKATPRSQWDPEPRKAETLIVLPNANEMDRYKPRALDLAGQAVARAGQLAKKEKEFARFIGPVADHQRRIRDAAALGQLFQLAERLDDLLKNAGIKDNAEKPNMPELWRHPEMKALKTEIDEFREEILYGDPLVVSRPSGKGRVVAMLTPIGTARRRGVGGEEMVQWNNWGAGEKIVSGLYPIYLLDMQRYLVSEGQAPNRVLGEEVNFAVDITRYEPKASYTFTAQPDVAVEGVKIEPEKTETVMTKEGNRLLFNLKDSGKPGVFNINLTLLGDGAVEDRTEKRSYAYNVDASNESNLKRASSDRLIPDTVPKDTVMLLGPEAEDQTVVLKTPDASEWPWLYLFIIIILVVEQALAVHLSHHTRSGDASQTESGSGAVPSSPASSAA